MALVPRDLRKVLSIKGQGRGWEVGRCKNPLKLPSFRRPSTVVESFGCYEEISHFCPVGRLFTLRPFYNSGLICLFLVKPKI